MYLIPAGPRRAGDTHNAHIADDDKPRCGAKFDDGRRYILTAHRCAFEVCPACEGLAVTGQLALFGEGMG